MIVSVPNSDAKLPELAISLMTSNPPTNSPETYNCGYVGQSESFFNSERTLSSVNISKEAKGMSFDFSISVICRENPHWGAFGEPFMNSITGATERVEVLEISAEYNHKMLCNMFFGTFHKKVRRHVETNQS